MTKRPVVFVLLREGSSDDGLLPHLADLLVRAGLEEAVGDSRPYKGTVANKLLKTFQEEAEVDLIFVHRDADGRSSAARRDEIAKACGEVSGFKVPVVPVVPIQELEAWLLTDEAQIRLVAGRPSGKVDLGLPKTSAIERVASPKELLRSALLLASETSGRRSQAARSDFDYHRRTLLERLDIDGHITKLDAWQQLQSDVDAAVKSLVGVG